MDPVQTPAVAESPANAARGLSRIQLLVNLGAFQLKLLFDGLRDILLVPVAFGCGLYGILFGGDHPDQYFNRLLEFGRRSDRFINLFNQHDDNRNGCDGTTDEQPTSDTMFAPYRERLVSQAHNSPLAARANKIVDQISDHAKPTDHKQDNSIT